MLCSLQMITNVAKYIEDLIEKDELWRFYKTPEWKKLKQQVLIDNHYECRICRNRGVITRYDEGQDGSRTLLSTVHHINEVRKRPDLALTRYYTDHEGVSRENLIPICKNCHNDIHHRTFHGAWKKKAGFANDERW